MVYGILAGNKVHLSEIARSLKENITLKNAFEGKDSLLQNYLTMVKRHVKEDYAVIIIDNSDIAKPASRKLKALSEIRDGSTDEITHGYLTIDAAILLKKENCLSQSMKRCFQQQKKDLSVKRMRIYAVWNPFPKISRPNASIPSTVVLMPMIVIAISSGTGSVLSSMQKRTGMSFITGRPVTP